MKNRTVTAGIILAFLSIIFYSCSSNNTGEPEPSPETIELEDAKLLDFPLFAITPISIEIIDPIIVDNEETVFGEINIIIPYTVSLDEIASSITSSELNLSNFDVLPGNATTLNYETESHIHTIVNALDNSEELLHYTVTITQEIIPTPSSLTVTDFKFEASKNAQLTEDIIIEKRFDDPNSQKQDIYLFVPEGTDFSNLTPTATFDAEAVFYTQDSSISLTEVDTPYPTTETNFDFSYPKSFIIVLKDDNRLKWVNVFVDIKNPVQLENSDITTPDVTTPGSSEYFTGITTWKNVGNHPIEFQSATTYENKIPDVNVNVITADRNLVTGGLIPGESANINVQVSGNLPTSEYKTTAVFYTGFYRHDAINDLVEPIKLNITANVIN